MLLRIATIGFLLVFCCCALLAQTPTGDINGVVSDSAGSVVPAVKVTLTNPANKK